MSAELVVQHSYPIGDIKEMANAIASSRLFGIKSPQEALALMLVAQSEGRHPATAAKDYHVFQGKPSLTSDAMLSRYFDAGGKVKWLKYDEKVCIGEFTHPASGTVSITWDIPMATKAGLMTKDVWKKYPRAMLKSRVISEGVRASFPVVTSGMHTKDELDGLKDEPPQAPKTPVDTPAEVTPVEEDQKKEPPKATNKPATKAKLKPKATTKAKAEPKAEAPDPNAAPFQMANTEGMSEPLVKYIDENTDYVVAYLKTKNLMLPDQEWEQLAPGTVKRIAQNSESFIKGVNKFIASMEPLE